MDFSFKYRVKVNTPVDDERILELMQDACQRIASVRREVTNANARNWTERRFECEFEIEAESWSAAEAAGDAAAKALVAEVQQRVVRAAGPQKGDTTQPMGRRLQLA